MSEPGVEMPSFTGDRCPIVVGVFMTSVGGEMLDDTYLEQQLRTLCLCVLWYGSINLTYGVFVVLSWLDVNIELCLM